MSTNDICGRLLTLDQVAERLQCSRRTVERRIAQKEIPALQLGGPRTAVRVDPTELELWLRAHSFRTGGNR
jgi:excisionase family DNA binding protein